MDTAKMQQVERSLAYEFAADVIANYCAAVEDAGGVGDAFDIHSVDDEDRELVDEALRYLEWRQLIQHDTERFNVIWILDESEGQ